MVERRKLSSRINCLNPLPVGEIKDIHVDIPVESDINQPASELGDTSMDENGFEVSHMDAPIELVETSVEQLFQVCPLCNFEAELFPWLNYNSKTLHECSECGKHISGKDLRRDYSPLLKIQKPEPSNVEKN